MEEYKDDIFMNQSTYKCARLAAGLVTNLCEAVMSHQVRNGFALVRPPGHHAEHHDPM